MPGSCACLAAMAICLLLGSIDPASALAAPGCRPVSGTYVPAASVERRSDVRRADTLFAPMRSAIYFRVVEFGGRDGRHPPTRTPALFRT